MGGNPEKGALYFSITPARNDGSTIYKLTVGDVPVDGIWSLAVYDNEGYFQPNQHNAYSLNSITVKKARMVRSPFSSAGVMARSKIAYRSRKGELHSAPLSPATGNPRWHVQISLGAARELSLVFCDTEEGAKASMVI